MVLEQGRFFGGGRGGRGFGGWSRGFGLRGREGDEGGADELSLEGVAGGDGFANGGTGFGFFSFRNLMPGGVEGFADGGGERGQADAAGGVAEDVLELRELLDERRSAGTRGGGVEGEGVVQHADDDLEPFVFGAAEFVHFEAQGAFLGVVGFLHEVGEGFGFSGHAFADRGGGGDGFGGVFLHGLPVAGGMADLRGDGFDVLNLGDGAGEGVGLGEFEGVAEIEDERQHAEQGAEGDTGADGPEGKVGEWQFALGIDEPGEAQHDGIAEEEGPFGDGGPGLFAHGGHGLEEAAGGRKNGCARGITGAGQVATIAEKPGFSRVSF